MFRSLIEINPFKLLMKWFLAVTCLFLMACDPNDSGGVIVVDDTPNMPTVPGPFTQDPNTDTEVVNPPAPLILPYTSSEIQAKIDAAADGGIIYLDRNVNMRLPVIVYKRVTFTKDPTKQKITIDFKQSGQFTVYAAGVKFTDLEMNVEGDIQPIDGQRDPNGLPLTSDFSLERNIFYLRNTNYYMQLAFNDLKVKNNSFIGLCEFCRDLFVLNIYNANGAEISSNVIVDTNNKYLTSLILIDVQNAVIKNNVIKSHGTRTLGTIGMLGCSNVTIQGNYLHDSNHGRLNSPDGVTPNSYLDGSISIAISASHGISDGGVPNQYMSDRYILDDRALPSGGSTNITFGSGVARSAFDNDDLFNYFPTMDLHPICLGSNPGLSNALVDGWLSYSTVSGSLYYAGAIIPACL